MVLTREGVRAVADAALVAATRRVVLEAQAGAAAGLAVEVLAVPALELAVLPGPARRGPPAAGLAVEVLAVPALELAVAWPCPPGPPAPAWPLKC